MTGQNSFGRRTFLCGAFASLALPARAETPRLAAIDWAMLETALALGMAPVAACELIRFRADSVWPEVPSETVDLGLRGSPNYELLQLARPDLILTSPWYAPIEPRLSQIAPILRQTIYTPGEAPWPKAVAALHTLAARIGQSPRASDVEAAAESEIATLAQRLVPMRNRPCHVIQIGDARHFRAFGSDSMFGNMLTRLGLENAWTRGTEFAFAAPLPLERLAERPDSRIIAVSGIPPVAQAGLRRSVLWNTLPAVADGRVTLLPGINPFGGIPAGLRFARLLVGALA